ncbi:hypothetical protein B566_EDAN007853 [Ephemera danica]|nr:hypothetical protein B566_EDAN007853 [Ephemera danica]
MPPKERKSLSQWMLCQSCGCTVSNKDLMCHSEMNCPPVEGNFVHGYIKENAVFSRVEELKHDAKSLRNIPVVDQVNIVQMSQQAMQLCDIGIGDFVVVHVMDKMPMVRVAWPTQEGCLTSVFFTKAGFELVECGPGSPVMVRAMMYPPLPAHLVKVALDAPCDLEPSHINMLLQKQQQGRAFKLLNKIILRHLGVTIKFTVTKVTTRDDLYSEKDVNRLAEKFQKLGVFGSCEEHFFFSVQPDTVFYIDSQQQAGGTPDAPTLSLSNIGGLDDVIRELQDIKELALAKVNPIPGLRPPRGILLHGVPGVGKTLLAQTFCVTSGHSYFLVRSSELFSKFTGETESRLHEIFTNAVQRAPSLIFLDEIDVLCQRRSSGGSQLEQRLVSALLSELDELQGQRVMVLAATSRPDAMDEALRRPGRLDREIELPVDAVASGTHGFVGADLQALCSQAGSKAALQCERQLTAQHLNWARNQIKPSAMREAAVEIPPVRWTDIGGQHDLKLKLQQAVEWPLKHPEAFTRLGIRPPRGVLMYGPPGCSKTMIAQALATESGLNFLSIKGPELFSKWVGESERAVRGVFRRARQVAPAIVFFDELDALCGERGGSGGGSSVQERVLAQLLTELDGVEPLGNVTVVAATNRPDRIDKALLRPGRLDRIIHVPLPDAATRREIFTLQFCKTPTEEDIDVTALVELTEGYSGAEVTAVCHEAALAALQEDISAAKVKRQHFQLALKSVTPRTSVSLLELYAKYHND